MSQITSLQLLDFCNPYSLYIATLSRFLWVLPTLRYLRLFRIAVHTKNYKILKLNYLRLNKRLSSEADVKIDADTFIICS